MSSRHRLKQVGRGSATPRLLGAAAWPVLALGVLLSAAAYLGSPGGAQQASAAKRGSPAELHLPLEPPVELLSVANSGFPCEVDQVLRAKCRRCHTLPPRHAAPFSLLTWEETRQQRNGQPIYQRMKLAIESGAMPMRVLANPPVAPLLEDEKRVLLDWVARGAPRGQCRLP